MPEANPRTEDLRTPLVWRTLETVIDPEVGLDIVTMGLVYGVAVHDDVAWHPGMIAPDSFGHH